MIDLTNNLIPTGTLLGTLTVGAGTTDYNGLENKPQINGVTLSGNKTTSDLGLFSGSYNDLTNLPTVTDYADTITLKDGFTKQSWGYVHAYVLGKICIFTYAGYRADSTVSTMTPMFGLPFNVNGYYRGFGKQGDATSYMTDLQANSNNISVNNIVSTGYNLYGEIVFYIQ